MAERQLAEGSRGAKTAAEIAYMECVRNCHEWNKRTITARINSNLAVFDQQTGIVQRPNDTLHRSPLERCIPSSSQYVCSYPAKRYRRSNQVSSDACEFKYLMTANPAIGETINSIVNPVVMPGPMMAENMESNVMPTRSATSGNRNGGYQENFEIDPMDYDFDEIENDPSDEDDWGSSRRKKKKNNPAQSLNRPSRRVNTNIPAPAPQIVHTNGNPPIAPPVAPVQVPDSRNYVCQQCGARYKSRPGLTYHRLHVHKEESMLNEMPKSPIAPNILANSILSPNLDVSKTCDLCQGSKELNKKTNVPEELVTCHDCGRSAHPTCLTFTPNMLITTKKYGWQCIECKSCTFCGTSEDDESLLFCDDCDRGFHLYCLKPPLKEPPEGKWSCHLCQNEFGQNASLPPQTSSTS
ncbi:hypothetical protein M3Y96_00887800 [Aphelenchoides besseyi]|nr:hypothetical protein M3Y96_00887800 [Aphelenchoides besseyi]